jgi:hypothetical protein
MIKPGFYSAFVLMDDQTWIQPAFHVTEERTEEEVNNALLVHGGNDSFGVYGLQESDEDWPSSAIQDLGL